jgi:hypothetical protein
LGLILEVLIKINVSNLPKGLNILNLIASDGQAVREKIVVADK